MMLEIRFSAPPRGFSVHPVTEAAVLLSAVHVIVRSDVEKEYLVISNLGSHLRKLDHAIVPRAAPDTARRDVRFGGGNALQADWILVRDSVQCQP